MKNNACLAGLHPAPAGRSLLANGNGLPIP